MSLLTRGTRRVSEPSDQLLDRVDLSPLFLKFCRSVSERKLFGEGARIVAAVSGGADSVCLLHLLFLLRRPWGLKLEVAHFEHGLRGEESVRDAEFVEALAARLNLPCHVGRGDAKGWAKEHGLSVQEAGRQLRYQFFQTVVEAGGGFLATAHTADDQAEEVLLRLLRGSGLAGLTGIPWQRDGYVVRPLLGASRAEICAHLETYGLSYVNDSSNEDLSYLRNRVRRRLIPFLAEEFNPSIVRTLNRTAAILAEDEEVLEAEAESVSRCALAGGHGGDAPSLEIEALRGVPGPVRRRVYRQVLQQVGVFDGRIRSEHLMGVDALAMGSTPNGDFSLPSGALVRRQYGKMFFMASGPRLEAASDDGEVEIAGAGLWPFPWGDDTLEVRPIDLAPGFFDAQRGGAPPRTLWVDADAIRYPLRLRGRRPGDRFWPLGAPGPCKLKKFMMARRVPRDHRDRWPLLVCGTEIVAVVGLEVAHPFRLRTLPKAALSLRWMLANRCCA